MSSSSKVPSPPGEVMTIPVEQFRQAVKKCWHLFHGENTKLQIPDSWYVNFNSGFPYPNNREDIMDKCLKVLTWDCELNMWDPDTYKLKRLADEFPQTVKAIEQSLVGIMSKDPGVTPTAATGFQILMRSNKSPLQQALLSCPNSDDSGDNLSNSVPRPDEWSPSLCFLPFQAFQAHIHWLASKDQYIPASFKELDVEILKLRYAEFLAVNLQTQNNTQLIVGIFTAYGPQIHLYPVRVIQILKQQGLLRSGTPLFNVIGSVNISSDAYVEIFENGVPIPKEVQLMPKPASIAQQSCSRKTLDKDISKADKGPIQLSKPGLVTNGAVTDSKPSVSVQQPSKSSVAAQQPSNPSVQAQQPSKPSVAAKHTSKPSAAVAKTITIEEFFEAVRPFWIKFSGEQKKKEIPNEWFHNYKSQFPEVNNAGGVLDACIQTILNDQREIERSSAFKIPRLADQFPNEFKDIGKDLRDLVKPKAKLPTTTLEMLMLNSTSLLQQALIKYVDLDTSYLDGYNGMGGGIPAPTQWAPNFSIFPFQAFVAHVRWYLRQVRKVDLKDIPMEILKLRYVEYLDVRGRKVNQLIVGIFTAYSHNILNYPVKVLQILHKRMLLEPSTKLYSAIAGLKISEENYINIFKIEHPKPIELSSQRCSTPVMSPSPSPLPLLRTLSQETNFRPRVPTPVPSPDINGIDSTKTLTISSEEFFECIVPCWKIFYGDGNKKAIPINWYSRYKSQFPEPNNKDGILINCIGILVRDQETIGDFNVPAISRLSTAFPKDFSEIEKNLVEAVPKQPAIVLHSGVGYDVLMYNKKSLLQVALVDPVKLDPATDRVLGKNSATVFQSTDWCPSRSVFPFPAFQAHVRWYVLQKQNNSDLNKLDVEVLKLRFVEYLSGFMTNTNQFLLSIFTAYGPHVLQYPVRVLEILKQRQLLRPGTKLNEVVSGVSGSQKSYWRIPSTPTLDSNTPAINHTSSAGPIKLDNVRYKSPATPPITLNTNVPSAHMTQKDWRVKCEEVLEEIRKDYPIPSPSNIPGSYFKKLCQSYRELVESDAASPNAFQVFALGLRAGIHLRDLEVVRENNDQSSQFAAVTTPESRRRASVTVPQPQPTNIPQSCVGERSLVSNFSGTGKLRVDAAGVQLLQSFGSTPLESVECVHNAFVRAKQLEIETLDKIQDEFSGTKMRDFVREISLRICWIADDADLYYTTTLIESLMKKKLISKAYVIDSIRSGVIKNLPELLVKVLNVMARVSLFLAYLFSGEEDFCWFLALTHDLHQDFLPVWIDLFRKTVDALKRRTSQTAVLELFDRTPGAQDILQMN